MPEYTGDILYHHYQNEELVQQLIDLGGILNIEKNIRGIITFKTALTNKMIYKKRKSKGFHTLTEIERKNYLTMNWQRLGNLIRQSGHFQMKKKC